MILFVVQEMEIEMNNNVLNEADKLREELREGSFGEEGTETSDNAADESVVADFLSQFGAAGDTPLKAHDWKVYIPSSILDNTDFWGPLFGIFRPETESFYVFDSKRFEDDQHLIGYVDNGSYLSSKCVKDFVYRDSCTLVGTNIDGDFTLTYTSYNAAATIAALRCQFNTENDLLVTQDGTVLNQADPTSATILNNGAAFIPVSQRVERPNSFQVKIKPYDTVTRLFSRNTGLLESGAMLEKRAVLVGCGSVGSLVAMELARSGVGKFVLCDTDTLEIHNICRHQCGFSDLGRYKVDAVKDKILDINPNAEVLTYRSIIQRVPEDELLPLLGRDTIIIGGGDNRGSADWACKLAIKTDSTFVSSCCWTRAFAGEIFYWASGKGLSCYTCALGGLIDSDRPERHANYFGTDEDMENLSFEPGIATDIDFVTIIAIKLALDLLNRDNPDYTPRVINYLKQYTWICNTNSTKIGGERAGIFSHPLQITHNLKVNRDLQCPYCGEKQ